MGKLIRPFGPEEHGFGLACRGWREVEKTCNSGLGEILARLSPLVRLTQTPGGVAAFPGGLLGVMQAGMLGGVRLDDVRAPIYWGLCDGSDMDMTQARILVAAVFDDAVAKSRGPLIAYVGLAWDIVAGALIGLEDEPILGEKTGAETRRKPRSPTARRASSTSSAPPA